MKLTYTKLFVEKNFYLLSEIPFYQIWKKESILQLIFLKKIRETKVNRVEKSSHSIYIGKGGSSIKFGGSKNLISEVNDFFYNFSTLSNLEELGINKNLNLFSSLPTDHPLSSKRRKRRKFSSEEERRIARILKNRRTAEESRQRRIQKMKNLENFAMISGDREKKLREEIEFLGKKAARQNLELILLKGKFEKGK